ncbi:hypothetical protein B0A54_13229 [Friedmanniomyces endolithicus]|uniref:Uncharacterized protein n=1 Tax=Friedmanniomyces endolithicus TaxID=329885 RepID=A0A4U0UN64_9PEZI|nr:hypothetical protein B0A54_13229 [Friedmanniomyces endolithicus]
MSTAARSLRLRTHLNALHRHVITRPYSNDTQVASHPPEDQAHFLRVQDQTALRDTQDHLDKLIAHVEKLSAHVASLPTSVPVPIRTRVRRKVEAASVSQLEDEEGDDGATTTIQYTSSLLRARQSATSPLATNIIAHAQHLHAHLTDLQHEPYPNVTGSGSGNSNAAGGLSDFETELTQLSRQEKEDLLKDVQYEEEAVSRRLKIDSRMLLERVKEVGVMSRRSAEDRGQRAGNPFLRAMVEGARKAVGVEASGVGASGVKSQGEGVKGGGMKIGEAGIGGGTKDGEAGKSAVLTTSLLELQKRLEESMKSGGS